MGHTAGLSGWEEPLAAEDLANWELCITRLAEQAPWWEPGTGSGYHALTQGYLIGEIVRRITGESIGAWFAREVAKPLAGGLLHRPPAERGPAACPTSSRPRPSTSPPWRARSPSS